MKEKLRKVRSFSELRIGNIVVKKSCLCCGKDHRYILIDFDDAGDWYDPDTGKDGIEPAFGAIPPCPIPAGAPEDAICPLDVEDGTIYLVEDGLELSQRELADAKAGAR